MAYQRNQNELLPREYGRKSLVREFNSKLAIGDGVKMGKTVQ